MTKQELYGMYEGTCTETENGSDEIESYAEWLERQLLNRLDKKVQVVHALQEAGFKQTGKEQYKHKTMGTLFMKLYSFEELRDKLMVLGEKHRAKKVRDVLMVDEDFIFNPQA